MKAVVQRVRKGRVSVAEQTIAEIDRGLVILLGVETGDSQMEAGWLADKCANLRIFEDPQGKMNLSALEVGAQALVVSQFTLFGDCRKGRRPSFAGAAPPEKARQLYNDYIGGLKKQGLRVASGAFQEMMEVALVNDGPVTFLLDSRKHF